jgi:hypothetical protein
VNEIIAVMRQLKSEGRSFGFDVISESAAAIEDRVTRGESLKNASGAIRELVRLCTQVRSTQPADAQTVPSKTP